MSWEIIVESAEVKLSGFVFRFSWVRITVGWSLAVYGSCGCVFIVNGLSNLLEFITNSQSKQTNKCVPFSEE